MTHHHAASLGIRRCLLATLVLAFFSAALDAGEPHKNWERFRGPNGTGTSDDKNIPLTFGANEKLIWKLAIPGLGNSSPIVWDSHLFLQSSSDDGKLRTL